jgi:hypothetical protein
MIPDIIYLANERKEPRLTEIVFDTNLLITFGKKTTIAEALKKKAITTSHLLLQNRAAIYHFTLA